MSDSYKIENGSGYNAFYWNENGVENSWWVSNLWINLNIFNYGASSYAWNMLTLLFQWSRPDSLFFYIKVELHCRH